MRWTLLAALLLVGCGEAVVDGACADGYAYCGGACRPAAECGAGDAAPWTDASDSLDLSDTPDPSDTLDPSDAADASEELGVLDATEDVVAGEGGEVSVEDATVGADTAGDSPLDATSEGAVDSALDSPVDSSVDSPVDSRVDASPVDGCSPPFTTAANCGGCGLACGGATPACKERLDGTWSCGPVCDAPTTLCASGCVDLDVDPANCGGCGKVCPTGLCNGGKCRGARAGHVVVVGHDFSGAAPGLAVSRVLENAVFLPTKNPVRVLALELYPDTASIAGVKANLDAAAAASGRTYTKSSATSLGDFRDRLLIDNFDVALIFDQPKAPSGAMDLVGSETKVSLDSFSRVGGVVVVLDGGGGEIPAFLTASTMLGVSSHTVITAKPVDVVAPADAIGVGVLSPYSAPSRSVTFALTEASSPSLVTVVLEPASSRPVVLHKVVFK